MLPAYRTALLRFSLICAGIASFALAGWHIMRPAPRTSQDIREQVPFVILVPGDMHITLSGWRYNPSQENLSFTARVNGRDVVVTEQSAPLAYRDDRAAYDRFVGTLKPFANFRSPLGTVSLFHLLQENTYIAGGDSAILLSHGTLCAAHPTVAISQDDWLALFRGMRAEE